MTNTLTHFPRRTGQKLPTTIDSQESGAKYIADLENELVIWQTYVEQIKERISILKGMGPTPLPPIARSGPYVGIRFPIDAIVIEIQRNGPMEDLELMNGLSRGGMDLGARQLRNVRNSVTQGIKQNKLIRMEDGKVALHPDFRPASGEPSPHE